MLVGALLAVVAVILLFVTSNVAGPVGGLIISAMFIGGVVTFIIGVVKWRSLSG